jgi:hypothetical protein
MGLKCGSGCLRSNGIVSVPPPAILKRMLLLVMDNAYSEHGLMETIPTGLDRMWSLGCDLDDTILNHSVLGKARNRCLSPGCRMMEAQSDQMEEPKGGPGES